MRLRELRLERGITQLKLGLDLHMSQNTISRYETGAREAGYAELCRIADYFGVTVLLLVGAATLLCGSAIVFRFALPARLAQKR